MSIKIINFKFLFFLEIDCQLHQACQQNDDYGIEYLIYQGANILSIDEYGKTPLELIDSKAKNYVDCLRLIIAALSMLIYEDKEVPENLRHTITTDACFNQILQESRDELIRMEKITFFENLNFYSLLVMSENKEEIAIMFNREEFEEGFINFRKFNFKYYERQLWRIYFNAAEIYTKFEVLFKLRIIFHNYLPDVVLRNLSRFLNANEL